MGNLTSHKGMAEPRVAFDRLRWRDPMSGAALEPIVTARTPAGVPICGALRVVGTQTGYPIVDCVARVTPELAQRHASWLAPLGLSPPGTHATAGDFQQEATVESFGWQWTWNSEMRCEADLKMRVADKFGVQPDYFRGRLVADMGAGAGDQSRYLLQQGATVVSIDLSSAIEVVAAKLRMQGSWFGVQGDITCLPFAEDVFDTIYCEGVIQHTRDSQLAVRELTRVLRPEGEVLAAHYIRNEPTSAWGRWKRKLTLGFYESLRSRLSRMERFKLLLVTGNLAALGHTPGLKTLVRRSGLALYYDLMPAFRTTWTNTYDFYGNHAYQRFLTTEQFNQLFTNLAEVDLTYSQAGNVRARKRHTAAAPEAPLQQARG